MGSGPTLDVLGMDELRKIAREFGAEVFPGIRKAELVDAIDYTAFDIRTLADREYSCRKCGCPIKWIGGAYVVMDDATTAGGLSYCPPDPDGSNHRDHEPARGR